MSIENDTAVAAFGAFAESITLNGADARAIVHYQKDVYGNFGETIDQRSVIDFLNADGYTVTAGMAVVIGGKQYKIDQPDRHFADPAITRWLLQ